MTFHKEKIRKIKELHFTYLGSSSSKIMDLLENVIADTPLLILPVPPAFKLQPLSMHRKIKHLLRYCKNVLSKMLNQIIPVKSV